MNMPEGKSQMEVHKMKLTFNVNKENKKAYVNRIAEFTGERAVYQFTPTYSYTIGDLTVNRDATLTVPDGKDVTGLIEALKADGYELLETEGATQPDMQAEQEEEAMSETQETETTEESKEDEGDSLTISVPLDSANIENLKNLIAAKKNLIEKALDIPDASIQVTDDKINFPWFHRVLSADESNAAMLFITALCRMSKTQKRVSAKQKETDNEKYAFRCFLLRLGFIGPEYKEARKILLQNLTGSSAFKSGKKARIRYTNFPSELCSIFSQK